MSGDHLHTTADVRVKGTPKAAECVLNAEIMLQSNIGREQWPIGHRGLGAEALAGYKAKS